LPLLELTRDTVKKSHFDRYLAGRYRLNVGQASADDVIEGRLVPLGGGATVSIKEGIPRFCLRDNYTGNFGLQWNKFRSTQLDSVSGLPLTANRFWRNTKWTPDELRGKRVLEAGSGAGRFTEILLAAGAQVVSFDYSSAVSANFANNAHRGDLFLFQGDVYDIPFPDDYFDYVFCYGVLQHTPDGPRAYRCLFQKLKPSGKISIDYYRSRWVPTPHSTPKYIWRPITRRMRPEKLLRLIQFYMPWYLPFDTAIRSVPVMGKAVCALIPVPCWNYLESGLNRKQRLEWAIMDTFDALGAAYDRPKTLAQVKEMVDSPRNAITEVFYGSNGVVANVVKK
jgi:SAM-dependent methyltransferase